MNKMCQPKFENAQHILLPSYVERHCSAQAPKKECHFADNQYPFSETSTVEMLDLYRSNIASMQWIFIVFYFPGEMLTLQCCV